MRHGLQTNTYQPLDVKTDSTCDTPLSLPLTFSPVNACLIYSTFLLNFNHTHPTSQLFLTDSPLLPLPSRPQSTLLNLIQSKLDPTTGYIHVNPQLRLGIFTQHHLDSFDLSLSPLQVTQRILCLFIDCVCALNCLRWVLHHRAFVFLCFTCTLPVLHDDSSQSLLVYSPPLSYPILSSALSLTLPCRTWLSGGLKLWRLI
jgi:hypothetical protein